MKSLPSLILAFGILGAAVADEGEDEWLPTLDGFVWPAPSPIQLSKEVSVPTSSFTKNQRKILAENLEGPFPETIHVMRADLNGDGVPELFIDSPYMGGSGGPVYEIAVMTKDGMGFIGSTGGGIRLLKPRKGEKWLQIDNGSRGGGNHMTRVLERWKEGRYVDVRNEDHDYTHRTVTLRADLPNK